MLILKTTPEFDRWLAGIRDRMVVQRLNTRLRKATLGHLGDVKPVGGGVYEMREHFGPGWRMYITRGVGNWSCLCWVAASSRHKPPTLPAP